MPNFKVFQKYFEKWQEEAIQKGIEAALHSMDLIKQGKPIKQIAEEVGLNEELVQKLADVVKRG